MQLQQEVPSQQQPPQDPSSDPFRQTSQTERLRRQYPRDIQGAKDEWKGMLKHQDEIKDSLRSVEQEIKAAKQDDLRISFLRAEKEKLEKRQYELQLKQQEFLDRVKQYQQYQQDLQRNKQDKTQLQQHLASDYVSKINEKQNNQQQTFQEKLAYEQQLINFNRQKIESEQAKRMQQKIEDKEDALLQLKLADQKKMQEKMSSAKNRDEYNQLMHENQLKEMMKEENYKNYYLRCAEFQGKNQEMHQQQVYNQIQQKNSSIQSIIEKNVEQAKQKQYQDELNRLQSRYNDAMDTKNVLQNQMNEKFHLKDLEQLEKQIKVEQRLKDLSSYQQYLQSQKDEKFQRQNEYQTYLRQQVDFFFLSFLFKMNEQNEKNLNKYRMTKDEKKFNFLDLQAYKVEDSGLYSMLPGWSPQIGGLTNNQKRKYFMEQRNLAQANKSTDLSPPQEHSPSEFTKLSKGVMTMAGVNPQGKRILHPTTSVDNYKAQPMQSLTEKAAGGKKIDFGKLYGDENSGSQTFPNRDNSTIFKMQQSYGNPYTGHNPITNPVPNNMQNPYILRQYKTYFSGNPNQQSQQGMNNNSNIFQNAGSSLIGNQ